MTVISISLDDLPNVYRRLGSRIHAAARRGALRGALRAVSTLQRVTGQAPSANPRGIGQGGAVNYGIYKRSWTFEPTDDGAHIYNSAPYAGIIEGGRRPGSRFPPKEPIVRWIQRRLGKSEKEARALAFVVRRAIARRGLLARKVLESSLPLIRNNFYEELVAELDREMRGGTP